MTQTYHIMKRKRQSCSQSSHDFWHVVADFLDLNEILYHFGLVNRDFAKVRKSHLLIRLRKLIWTRHLHAPLLTEIRWYQNDAFKISSSLLIDKTRSLPLTLRTRLCMSKLQRRFLEESLRVDHRLNLESKRQVFRALNCTKPQEVDLRHIQQYIRQYMSVEACSLNTYETSSFLKFFSFPFVSLSKGIFTVRHVDKSKTNVPYNTHLGLKYEVCDTPHMPYHHVTGNNFYIEVVARTDTMTDDKCVGVIWTATDEYTHVQSTFFRGVNCKHTSNVLTFVHWLLTCKPQTLFDSCSCCPFCGLDKRSANAWDPICQFQYIDWVSHTEQMLYEPLIIGRSPLMMRHKLLPSLLDLVLVGLLISLADVVLLFVLNSFSQNIFVFLEDILRVNIRVLIPEINFKIL